MGTDFLMFVGTGSAQASKERFHSSFIFSRNNRVCLIDAGDGVSKALVSSDIPFDSIDSVIISHMHPDHYSGLAGLLIQRKLINRKHDLTLFIDESLKKIINDFLIASYLFPERLGFTLHIQSYTTDEFFNPLADLEVLARQNSHLDDYISHAPGGSFSCSSYLFTFKNRTIFYTGDIGAEKDLYLFDDYNLDILISEVTHIDPDKIFNAFSLEGGRRLYLTHISHGDEQKLRSILSQMEKETAEKIIIARDGLRISI